MFALGAILTLSGAMMKLPIFLLAAAGLACAAFSADEKPLLVEPGAVLAQPDLKQPLADPWTKTKGSWEANDGELVAAEVPEDHHAAVLWNNTGRQSGIVECEARFDGGKGFLIGLDGPAHHVGRLVVNAKQAKLSDDSTEIKGKQPGTTLAEAALSIEPGRWFPVRFEWAGDKMAARVDGHELQGQSAPLSTQKVRWWFAVSGAKVTIRNVKMSEGK